MRLFQDFKELYSEVGRDLKEMGIRVRSESVQNIQDVGEEYEMLELTGYAYRTISIRKWQEVFSDTDYTWVVQETGERIQNQWTNPGKNYLNRAQMWVPFLDKDARFDYTYNERIRLNLSRIISELARRPNTRQAVLTIFWPEDSRFMGGKIRIPCSLNYQFIRRNGELHVIYSMRSCDYFNHFKFDVVLAWNLGKYISQVLGIPMASLTHFIGSLHAFKKDADKSGIF